jgi:hypothetical protein
MRGQGTHRRASAVPEQTKASQGSFGFTFCTWMASRVGFAGRYLGTVPFAIVS